MGKYEDVDDTDVVPAAVVVKRRERTRRIRKEDQIMVAKTTRKLTSALHSVMMIPHLIRFIHSTSFGSTLKVGVTSPLKLKSQQIMILRRPTLVMRSVG